MKTLQLWELDFMILRGSFQLKIFYDSMLWPVEIKTVPKTVCSRLEPSTGNFAECEKVFSSETFKDCEDTPCDYQRYTYFTPEY